MEGKLEGIPLFEQVAVLKEIDLHQTWAPFCTSSLTIKDLDKLDTVGWFVMGAPQFGLARDGCFRAIGCDNIAEDGNILIYGQGIQDRPEDVPYNEPYLAEGMDEIDVPEKPTKMGSDRMTIRQFTGAIKVLSATSYETVLVANINPNLPLPNALLDFITRKICGVVISKIQSAAKKALKDPVRNPHARRIRESEDFYKGWLLPKFEAFCEMNNWSMPKVSALDLTDEELEKEFLYAESLLSRQVKSTDSSDEQSTDTTSRITVGSSTTQHFSIMSYLQEMEERTNEKKARKIAAARRRAANRLKPRDRTPEEMRRLNELKEAKRRRNRNRGVPDDTVMELESLQRKLKKPKKDGFSSFYKHSRGTRFLITSGLCLLLGAVLNPDILISDLLEQLEEQRITWWSEIMLDIGSFLYISVCTLIHFALCDVLMIYAFGALDLGMKSGRQSKEYYDARVRAAAALMSGSIAAFSTGKAVWSVSMRAVAWCVIRACELSIMLATRANEFLGEHIPAVLYSVPGKGLSFGAGATNYIMSNVSRVGSALFWLVHVVFIQSNRIGQLFEYITRNIWSFTPPLYSGSIEYATHVRGVYEDTEVVPTWRGDAIENMRFLFSYSAVFLLSILLLFNWSSRANKKKTEKWHNLSSSVSLPDGEALFPPSGLNRDDGIMASISGLDDDHSDVSVTNASGATRDTKFSRLKLRLRKKKRVNGSKHSQAQVPTVEVLVP